MAKILSAYKPFTDLLCPEYTYIYIYICTVCYVLFLVELYFIKCHVTCLLSLMMYHNFSVIS